MEHRVFKPGMTSDSAVFIINHTQRDYIHNTKIIDMDDLGLVVQWYLQDATLTFARRDGEYRIIEIEAPISKEEYEAIEVKDVQPYLDKHYQGMTIDEVAAHGKTHSN